MTETQQAQQQAAISLVESLELVRCLLRVSIFHTSYLRGIFPENCFKEIPMAGLDGMVIKMLLPGKNKDALRLVEWVEHGLHDAVEKGYLETMTFGLSRDKEGKELVEQFHYNFAYEGNAFTMTDSFGTNVDVPLSQSSQADRKTVKYQIVRMMRMLIQICTTLGPLPEERYVFMKLTYNENTPAEYEPPFFRQDDDRTGHFSSRPFSLDLGTVKTNYHEVSLAVRSACDPDEEEAARKKSAEGQGQTPHKATAGGTAKGMASSQTASLLRATLPDTAIEGGISVPPLGLKSASIGDESLLADLMTYCVEGGKSTIDLAGAKAKFADVEVALLERCFDALIIKGTLQADPNQAGAYLVSSTRHLEITASKKTAGITPAASASSKFRSQRAEVGGGAGSCRTNSTGLKQAQTGSALNATSTSPAATFMNTQDSNRHGRKRKASRAEEPIYQHLGDGKLGTRLRLLKMQRNS